ncbi:hypothetical protein HMPREF1551_00351 [Capnocytophaga sp. oral taxon 863 str. F0517]|nr:hypothetical protein HMPREF1551_00351 [Capnocytophaga sp. oral taxon 863 str. F0517]
MSICQLSHCLIVSLSHYQIKLKKFWTTRFFVVFLPAELFHK